jgi:hypothetical protein
VKVIGQKGMYPIETPYFVVPPEIQQKYGDKPTELDIIFPIDDEERIFPQALKMYGQSGLKCIGNGEQAKRLNDRTYQFEVDYVVGEAAVSREFRFTEERPWNSICTARAEGCRLACRPEYSAVYSGGTFFCGTAFPCARLHKADAISSSEKIPPMSSYRRAFNGI